MSELNRVLQLADKNKIDFLSGDVLAAIWMINSSTADVDKRSPQSVSAHNADISAAHEIFDNWRDSAPDGQYGDIRAFQIAVLEEWSTSEASSPILLNIIPGKKSHTHPITLTSRGTGLRMGEKAPRYDRKGHII